MRSRLPTLGFHARLTLTIAGAFIGAMLVILVLALAAAENFDLAIVSTSFNTVEDPGPTDMATPQLDVSDPPDAADGPDPPDVPEQPDLPDDELVPGAVYVVDEAGAQGQVVQLPEDRFPTLIRSAFVTLALFAIVAIVLASWISRRSLGRIAGITAMARGLSERHLDRRLNLTGPDDEIKQLGDTFDGMLERLERVFTSQSLFIANASHELRTPLTTARAALEIPLVQGRVPDDLRPAVERALAANRRSEELIAALLLLARGRLAQPDLHDVELQDLVRDALAAAEREARVAGVTIHADLGAARMRGNATLLAEAITNLVENAVRHNIQGGEAWVALTELRAGARLTIANTGATHTPETAARLIEPFHRHDATRTSGPAPSGFGLGLAIVESVAAMHGGALSLAPRDGGGLVATLDLPADAADDRTTP